MLIQARAKKSHGKDQEMSTGSIYEAALYQNTMPGMGELSGIMVFFIPDKRSILLHLTLVKCSCLRFISLTVQISIPDSHPWRNHGRPCLRTVHWNSCAVVGIPDLIRFVGLGMDRFQGQFLNKEDGVIHNGSQLRRNRLTQDKLINQDLTGFMPTSEVVYKGCIHSCAGRRKITFHFGGNRQLWIGVDNHPTKGRSGK